MKPGIRSLFVGYSFVYLLLLTCGVLGSGCSAPLPTTRVSPDSELGKAMGDRDATEKQRNKNMRAYQSAIDTYEAAQGRKHRSIKASTLCDPIETVGPGTQICILEAASEKSDSFDYDYRARVTYEDDTCRVVKRVEVLDRMDLKTSAALVRPIKTAPVPIATVRCDLSALVRLGSALAEADTRPRVSGSHEYVIRVRSDTRTEATEIIKRDAEVHKYEVTFY
jgi:hypothetical protein